MRKIKATKKEMRENYRILGVGYCEMQHLLEFQQPFAYSSGVAGWLCDYYRVGGVIISTGYSPLGSKGMVENYELIRDYEKRADSASGAERATLIQELLEKLKK